MLQKESLSYLKKHSWVSYLNRGNKSQKIKRTISDCNFAFAALSLMAYKLPDDLFQEIFTRKNIAMLLISMQKIMKGENTEEERLPDLRTADFLVQHGLDIMIKEYKKLSWYTPEIAQLTLDHLAKTKAICTDIALNAEATNLEIKAKEQNRQYLFTWKQISNKDYQRFKNFVFGFIDNKILQKMTTIKGELDVHFIEETSSKIEGYIVDPIKYPIIPDEEDYREGEIILEMNIPKSLAVLELLIPNKTIKKKFKIEYRNEDYYFYYEKTQPD